MQSANKGEIEMTQEKKKRKSKRIMYVGASGFIIVIVILGIISYIESVSDPIIVEVLFNDTATGESLSKITHLKDGTIDYIFNYSENIGSTTIVP